MTPESTRHSYDVIVVGAGPAGSTCAWFAAQAGLRVLVLDASTFPRDKACGDAISRTKAVPILREMGLVEGLDRESAQACAAFSITSCRGDTLNIPAPLTADPLLQSHRIFPRRAFDQWLLEHVKSCAEVREGMRVTDVLREDGRVAGVVAIETMNGQPHRFRSRIVVGADGAYSVVAKQTGLRRGPQGRVGVALRGYLRGIEGLSDAMEFYYLEDLLPGALWIFPCGPGVANVGLAVLKERLASTDRDAAALLWRLIKTHPTLQDRFARAELVGSFRGWPIVPWAKRLRLSADGVLLVGDAAQLIDPVTGEGIGNGMVSGKLAGMVAAKAIEAHDVSARFLQSYDRQLWTTLGRELRLAYVLQRLMAHRWFVDAVVSMACSHALIAEAIRRVVQAPAGKRHASSLAGILRACWSSAREEKAVI